MALLEYRKKPAYLLASGVFLSLFGVMFFCLPVIYFLYPASSIASIYSPGKYFINFSFIVLSGIILLSMGIHLVFSRRKVVIDIHSKMVITRKGWVGGLKEKTTDAFPFHSFRSISVGGVKKPGKNTYFYPVLLGMKDIVIPCGSKNKKEIGKEIIKISEYMNLNMDKKYSKVSRSVAFKG